MRRLSNCRDHHQNKYGATSAPSLQKSISSYEEAELDQEDLAYLAEVELGSEADSPYPNQG
jgi:hypothetical protein